MLEMLTIACRWFLGVLLLLSGTRSQFVEFYTDFKKNHIDDEINYAYRYYVDDAPSAVHLHHHEQRRGQHVSGQFGLLEPDGNVRSVHYEVDGEQGFRTVIHTRTAASRTHQRLQLRRPQPAEPLRHADPVAFVTN